MLVMGAVCVPFAVALMLPDDLENFGQSLFATVLSINNVLAFLTADYFDQASEFKPLLHTWSLGVEEQYYLVIPLTLMLAYKLAKRAGATVLIGVGALVSFAISVWASSRFPEANFYLPFSRAWELGAGGLLALSSAATAGATISARSRSLIAAVGMLLILGSFVLVDETMSLPSWATLPCVLGTLLRDPVRQKRRDRRADPGDRTGGLDRTAQLQPLSLPSAVVRFHARFVADAAAICADADPAAAATGHLLRVVAVCRGAIPRPRTNLHPLRHRAVLERHYLAERSRCDDAPVVRIQGEDARADDGDPGYGASQNAAYNMSAKRLQDVELPAQSPRKRILVIGNSFARDFVNMGLASGNFDGHLVSYVEEGECLSAAWPALAAKRLPNADFVVLGSEKPLSCLVPRAAALRRTHPGRFVVIGIKNFGWNNNAVMLLPQDVRYRYRAKPLAEDAAMNEAAKAVFDPREYVDVLAMLSSSDGTVPVFTPERKFISQDRRHVTEAGAKYVGEIVFRHPTLARLRSGRAEAEPETAPRR